MISLREAIIAGGVLASAAALGVGLQAYERSPVPRLAIEAYPRVSEDRASERRRAIAIEGRPEHELVLVYVGSPFCAFCRTETVKAAVATADSTIAASVAGYDIGYHRIGVTTNVDPVDGWRHLNGTLQFDEVMVGRGWANSGALRYLWQEHPGQAATPTLLLVRRRMTTPYGETGAQGAYGIEDEEVLQRIVGMNEARDWAERRLPAYLEVYLRGQPATGSPDD